MTLRFAISAAQVEQFAALTGDRNAQHMDEQFARRFRYRRRVVHGMLSFSRLFELTGRDLLECDTRFLKPVFMDDPIILEAAVDGESYDATWRNERTGELLIKSKGMLAGPSRGSGSERLLLHEIDESARSIDEMAGASESLRFRASSNAQAALLLSTLVGMRLPGRFATFMSFQIRFDKPIEPAREHTLVGSVEKVTPATESVSLNVAITRDGHPVAAGKISALVSPPPRAAITSAQIRERHLDPGLRDKVAIVTGASRGIGAATAKLLAMHGVKVVVNYFKGQADAEDVVADIRSAGGAAVAIGADVTDPAQVKVMFATAQQEFGGVDIVVNNAVKDFAARDIADLDWSDFLAELEVSVKGVVLCAQAAAPIFKQRGGGKIVNLSTIAVDVPVKGQSKYITAKSAVIGLTRSLAREFAADNIQVNVLAPNMTETDLLAALPATIVQRIAQLRPAGRNLDPIEVAQAVVFLASQWSNSMTGQKVVLNLGEPPFT